METITNHNTDFLGVYVQEHKPDGIFFIQDDNGNESNVIDHYPTKQEIFEYLSY